MNLNFTFTTRDKILLLVLAVILFVGMMYLYGVMPANEEMEDLEGQISAKQQELAQLQAQIAGINIAGIDAEYDKLLDYYYTADRGELAENIGIIAINRMIIAVLDEHNISGYSTVGWKITEERLTGSYGDYTGDYYIASATCPVPYTAAPEDLYALIDNKLLNASSESCDMGLSCREMVVHRNDGSLLDKCHRKDVLSCPSLMGRKEIISIEYLLEFICKPSESSASRITVICDHHRCKLPVTHGINAAICEHIKKDILIL